MPTLTIEGFGTFEVEKGKRLVNAVTDCGVDIGHRCGGNARCTTCRVEIAAGDPQRMTRAELDKRLEKNLPPGTRLSCQLLAEADMELKPVFLASKEGWPDAGPPPEDEITPPAEWVDRPY